MKNQGTSESKGRSKFLQGCLITVGIFLLLAFGFIAGVIATTGYISLVNNVSPTDLLKPGQLWQEYFYREKESEGEIPETLPKEFKEEIPEKFKEMQTIWSSNWSYEFSSGYWSEGEHQIKVKCVFPDWYDFDKIPEDREIDKEIKEQFKAASPPTYETTINFKVDSEAKKHKTGVIFDITGLYTFGAYTSGKEIGNRIINPEDRTVFLIGWITDYEMKYEEAKRFYDNCTVEISIDDDVLIEIKHSFIIPYQQQQKILGSISSFQF